MGDTSIDVYWVYSPVSSGHTPFCYPVAIDVEDGKLPYLRGTVLEAFSGIELELFMKVADLMGWKVIPKNQLNNYKVAEDMAH